METSDLVLITFLILLNAMIIYLYYKLKDKTKNVAGLVIPSGTIIMWNSNDIPDGWVLCDGSNDTPDLTGKFVAGAGLSSNTNETMYELMDKGGENFHSLTEDENGRHNHGALTGELGNNLQETDKPYFHIAVNRKNTGTSGEGKAHENRPPYVALVFIMKL